MNLAAALPRDQFALLDLLPIGCCVFNRALEITHWNRTLEVWTGLGHAEVVGRSLVERFPALAASRYRLRLEDVIERGTPAVFSATLSPHFFPTLAHKAVVQHTTVHHLDAAGGPFGLIAVNDVTDQHQRAEAYRRQKSELRTARDAAAAAVVARAAFTAVLGHEIRTPLAAIQGLAELLAEDERDPERRAQLDTIRSSAGSLTGLLNDLLDVAKLEAGRMELDPQPTDLRQLLRDLAVLYAGQARARGLILRTELAPEALTQVSVDGNRLRQMLGNLIANALKFTTVGEIVLRLASIQLPGQARPITRLAVTDTGPGIPPEIQARLFTPFTQAGPEVAARHGGTGLGLSIVRELVELMGGTIRLDSVVGQGSTFTMELPLAPAAVAGTDDVLPRGLRVLLADDHLISRQVGVALLRRSGCEVSGVIGGQPALQAWAPGRFDVVLLDVEMPDLDGFETARQLRAREAAAGCDRVRILMLTAHAAANIGSQLSAAGADGHLAKPFNDTDLVRALR